MGEPIAIVGMACKFPGAPDLESFWSLLESGGNAVTEGVPGSGVGRIGELYPESANQYPACRYAALIDDIDLFDAEFFRISPVEAQLLDPQQRILLETSWTALEDALVDPAQIPGSRTGVFIGISNNDYRVISLNADQPTEPAASLYTVSGTSFNTAAGRVAYALGLEGPAMAVDTACSSSLFALHQAIASLERDESDLALVGGTQAIFLGRLTELRAKAGMLSPDGRCKAFDASANGFVRGEGCGIVVLKRLKDAEAHGDRIWGVILGSAVNQDGTSAGLTVPSETAQARVIEDALRRSGIEPHDVDYLEAHGTGTEVGDPIELNAAAQVYGRGRHPDSPLLVGSVKTNVGHLEPTAGVAGLMKAILSMQRGIIPKHLHFNDPNPRLDWERLPVKITTENTRWPVVPHRPPRAAVSSYGWSGTNVHVLVEGCPDPSGRSDENGGTQSPAGPPRLVPVARSASSAASLPDETRPARVLPLAGKTHGALRDLAKSYLLWLDGQDSLAVEDGGTGAAVLADMAWTAAVARSHFEYRDALVFRDASSLRGGLRQLAASTQENPDQRGSRIAFAYTGQGNQWVGMGEALYRTEPVFRAVLDRCDHVMQEEGGSSLLDVMFGRPGAAGDLDEPRWTQPSIYALECALTALWASVGIRPDAVVGHSMGEIAAAHAAGVLSLEDGLRFASARGRIFGDLPVEGAMAAVFAPESEVVRVVAEWNTGHPGADLCIGVDNGTHQVVSGSKEAVHALADRLNSKGVNVRQLRPSPAYHSSLLDPGLDELEAALSEMEVSDPTISLVSNLTGAQAESKMDAGYWRQHARQPVAFRRCVETLAELGVDTVIEVGPHAILGPLVSLNWPQRSGNVPSPVVLQSLLRPSFDGSEPERADAFVHAVAGAYRAGLSVDFAGLFAGEERRKIPVPGYPFQRRRYWVQPSRVRRFGDAHPLLGSRHESPRGELMFETEMFPSDPSWLNDHKVFGRVVMPGAVYGAMAAAVAMVEDGAGSVVEDLQLHNPLVYPEHGEDNESMEPGRRIQLVVDGADGTEPRGFEVFSKGGGEESWTIHAEGRLVRGLVRTGGQESADLTALRAGLEPQDLSSYYRSKAATGINFGPSFRTLESLWGREGEAVGEIALQGTSETTDLGVHPLLLDGCFQVFSAARNLSGIGDADTYLPFGWERLWLRGPLPDRLACHARIRELSQDVAGEGAPAVPETLTGDLRLYTVDGSMIGGLTGFVVKRATRAALLAGAEQLQDLLYEIDWRERPLAGGIRSADALAKPSAVAAETDTFAEYLSREGVEVDDRVALLADLERLARSYALAGLEGLGWRRVAGEEVEPEALRDQLQVIPQHSLLLARMLRLVADAGILERTEASYRVLVGAEDVLPDEALADPEAFADRLVEAHPHGSNEVGLLRRSGGTLADGIRGDVDPLSILFPTEGPGATDYYFSAPASRASNRILANAVAATVANWPEERRLRILEVGAGTGSGTAVALPELPEGRFDYVFTDISAGFFAVAEDRFRDSGAPIEYRRLDIERDPGEQGFDLHAYDIVIAVNVLHATQNLQETLTNCRKLLAPSGRLLAVENLRGRGWQDMTFGQLDGWWRYSDAYRPNHAMASPEVWLQALADSGFEDSAVLGGEHVGDTGPLGSGVILGQGPEEVALPRGVWVLASDDAGRAESLASGLASQNQVALLAGVSQDDTGLPDSPGVRRVRVDAQDRGSWRELLDGLPAETPLFGVIHCSSLSGHGAQATTEQMAADVKESGAGALALVQALLDSDTTLDRGLWFMTRGSLALERDYFKETAAELSGAALWGLGKVVAREAEHLQPRMIDLAPEGPIPVTELVNELLFPDSETHVAYRSGERLAARLVRRSDVRDRIDLPDEEEWRLAPTTGEGMAGLHAEPCVVQPLNNGEVRVAVESIGLNFSDVLVSMDAVESQSGLGDEFCGRITEVAPDVTKFAPGDRVVGLGIGTLRSEVVTNAKMVAPAPRGMPVAALATIPLSFVSAELGFRGSGLNPGDRVLIHTASGGTGLAAIQLVIAADAEVFATASAPKHDYLKSLGISHVYDSRSTNFGEEILRDTQGAGVDVVLNSLTGPGFIEASLACLAQGGRFVEMGRRGIWTADEMAAARPDVGYSVLAVDALKVQDPAAAGASLQRVMERLEDGELQPLVHTRWPIAEVRRALNVMRSARHIGKNVVVMPPGDNGRLREDRTYLVTGGLGGIGCVVAEWLSENGAGTIVLNGRRPPDEAAEATIEALRRRGADVRVELADVTDPSAIDRMLERITADMPPLGGVIHSVGVLSDAALSNQTWGSFERVMWPKVLGAWHLHRATIDMDLDLFILFSSLTGVLGNRGQGNHAAANAFLDQLAGYRRSLGLPGQSIAWGAWAGLGEAEEQRERIERQLAASGTGWISPGQGLEAFDDMVRRDVTTGLVAAVDWRVIAGSSEGANPFLEDLVSERSETGGDGKAAAAEIDLLSRLRETPGADREPLLVGFLQDEIQDVLKLTTAPSPTVGFFDLGMDSLMSVEFRNRLNRTFAGEYVLSNTAVFDYPNAAALAKHLASEITDALGQEGEQVERPTPAQAISRSDVQNGEEAIAIVGMACRFPGAPDLASFWRLLESGKDAITDGRTSAGPWGGIAGDPAASDPIYRRGGFLESIDQFDNRFFRISPIEARMMDPQQRILLETTWQALEDAGIDPVTLQGSLTGVYLGIGGIEYRDVIAAKGQEDLYFGTSGSMTAGRVAFVLGLEGPAMPVDVACASSLAAVHQAAAALKRGEVDLALAGGVNATLSQSLVRFHHDLGMLSGAGRCNAFDASADGFVRSEGCGVVALKRLSEAEADGDRIWGVVRGSAVNQNGASAGLPVPRGPAQERVMVDSLARAGIRPDEVDYLEAHATGTDLGDSIELNALASVYGRGREPESPLLVGSVKTNIGHAEWAAGMAGLMKVVLAMKTGVIPVHLHFHEPNPNFDWDQLPVRITSQSTPWPVVASRPRLAAVNSFGLSGSNAHVIVQGYDNPDDDDPSTQQPSWATGRRSPVYITLAAPFNGLPVMAEAETERTVRLLPLSGKSQDALCDLAGLYLNWISDGAEKLASGLGGAQLLADMAWTAGIGRSHFPHRVGMVFRDVAELKAGLRVLVNSRAVSESLDTVTAPKAAFIYTGQGTNWAQVGEALYRQEPVARAVLDRCEEIVRQEQGTSLLDVMFNQPGALDRVDDQKWSQPATYALEAALTALLQSAGIRPGAVMGFGIGEVSAAMAAGVLSLEDGLRLALAAGNLGAVLPKIDMANPSMTLVNGVTGKAIGHADELTDGHWFQVIRETAVSQTGLASLANAGANLAITLGPQIEIEPAEALKSFQDGKTGQALELIDCLFRPGERPEDWEMRFLKAVGASYENGLDISFFGLFAGEERRRIAVPGYPFQRRSFWVQERRLGSG